MNNNIFQDWSRNKNNIKSLFVLTLFRLAVAVRRSKVLIILFFWYLIIYRLLVEWFLCIELPWSLQAGAGLRIEHGQALVVNGGAIIGKNCSLKHSTTIGSKLLPDDTMSRSPILGDGVDVGAQVCIIGPITIGDNVTIGVGAIVITDVPPICIVAGNPAKILRMK
jgi:serine acetyltransferase